MIVLGLTGSIGMGKTTTGAMLETLGVPVHDADAQVHVLLEPGGKGAEAVSEAFPCLKYPKLYPKKIKGVRPIDRKALGKIVFRDNERRELLEEILHPLVQEEQQKFINKNNSLGVGIVALDIPLLFETGAEARVDYTVNVSAPHEVQRARVLDRPGMTEEKFGVILNRQMLDGEKCLRADFVVHTGLGRAHTMKELKKILLDLRVNLDDEKDRII